MSQFIIAGPIQDEEQYWWSNDLGWTSDQTEATTFPKGILTETLPVGARGLLEMTMKGEPIGFLQALPLPGRASNSSFGV